MGLDQIEAQILFWAQFLTVYVRYRTYRPSCSLACRSQRGLAVLCGVRTERAENALAPHRVAEHLG